MQGLKFAKRVKWFVELEKFLQTVWLLNHPSNWIGIFGSFFSATLVLHRGISFVQEEKNEQRGKYFKKTFPEGLLNFLKTCLRIRDILVGIRIRESVHSD